MGFPLAESNTTPEMLPCGYTSTVPSSTHASISSPDTDRRWRLWMLKSVLSIPMASKVATARIPLSLTPSCPVRLQRMSLTTPFSLSITGSSQDVASIPSRLKNEPSSTPTACRIDGSNVRSKAKLCSALPEKTEMLMVNWSPGLIILSSRKSTAEASE